MTGHVTQPDAYETIPAEDFMRAYREARGSVMPFARLYYSWLEDCPPSKWRRLFAWLQNIIRKLRGEP